MSSPLQPGDRMGDWVVEDPLGAGGMGTVYAAHNALVPDLRAAVKVLRPHALADIRERFFQEIRAIYTLRHDHIVRVVGFGEDTQREVLWLAMDLVDGGDLESIIDQGPLDSLDALRLFDGLVSALCHVHEMGVFHRDLKPGNVLVDSSGNARLVDFGIAVQEGQSRLTATGTVLGTPAYLAPEVLSQEAISPALCDVYATGQLLFEVLTGTYAFAEDASLSDGMRMGRLLASKLQSKPLDPGDAVPSSIRALVRDATAPDPSRRIATAQELHDRLRDAIARPDAYAAPPMMPAGSTIPIYVETAIDEEVDSFTADPAERVVGPHSDDLVLDGLEVEPAPSQPTEPPPPTPVVPQHAPTGLVSFDQDTTSVRQPLVPRRRSKVPMVLVVLSVIGLVVVGVVAVGMLMVPSSSLLGVAGSSVQQGEGDLFGVQQPSKARPAPEELPTLLPSVLPALGALMGGAGPTPVPESSFEPMNGVNVARLQTSATGTAAQVGDTVSVHYTGWLQGSATPFDSNEQAAAFAFTLGEGKVIDGWERALVGARQGDELQFVVPPALGYGTSGRPGIPPNSTLVFEVRVLGVSR